MPAQRIFVGRRNELEQFTQALGPKPGLLQAPGHGVRARVFLPHGIGGMGKTELARQCLAQAKQAGWHTLWVDWERLPAVPVEPQELLNALAEALGQLAPHALKAYTASRQKIAPVHAQVKRYRAEHPEEWQGLLELARKAADGLPDAPKAAVTTTALVLDYGPKALARAHDLLLEKLQAKGTLKAEEAQLFKNADAQLAQHLVAGLVSAAKAHGLALALDTCEVLAPPLERFLRDQVVCPAVEQARGLLVLVCGRHNQYREREVVAPTGQRTWLKGYADRLTDPPPVAWDLARFADPEVRDYLQQCGLDPTPALVQFVQRTACGVPFAVQLVTDALLKLGLERVQQDFPPLDVAGFDPVDLVAQVVRRFLRYCVTDGDDEARLRALALLPGPNRDEATLRAVWALPPTQNPRSVLADLEARYGFVLPGGALHDVVGQFLRASLRSTERETAHGLGQRLCAHTAPLWQAEAARLPQLAERLAEHRWHALTRAHLNALCWGDEDAALPFLAACAVEALVFDRPFARSLVQQAREFRDAGDWWATRSQRHFDALAQALEGDGAEALAGLDALLRAAPALQLTPTHRCLLHLARGQHLNAQGRFDPALAACQTAETTAPTADESVRHALAAVYADVGSSLGFQKRIAVASTTALTAYERAVALDPTQAAHHNGLGAMLGMSSKQPEAQQRACACFTRALELEPKNAVAFNNRGVTYQELKNYPAALADYTRALELDPMLAQAFSNRGNTYSDLKDYPAALADYTRALELQPNYADAFNNRGLTYHALQDYPAALADYTRAVELDPTLAQVFNNRGATYADLKDYPAALADYTRALELQPDYAKAFSNRGLTYHALQDYPAALADYTRAIELQPDYAQAFSNRGSLHDDLKDYPAALADYTRAIELQPDDAQAFNNRGITYKDLKDYPAALADYTRAIALQPDYAKAFNNRGNTYHALQDHPAALADYTRALELQPDYAAAFNNRGVTYKDLKDYPAALTDFTRAIELQPDYADAFYNRGSLYDDLQDYPAALADYTRALELDPQNAYRHNAQGNAYRALGQYQQAIAAYQRAIELDPQYVYPHNHLGIVYLVLGQLEDALWAFQKAVELDPNTGAYRGSLVGVLRRLGRAAEAAEQAALARPLMENENEYNRACFAAICGDAEEAIALLQVAIEKKLASTEWAAQDPDFDSLRHDPRYRALVGLAGAG